MLYTEAFRKLGYELDAPRTDWSAENEGGVCISIWAKEIRFEKDRAWFDSKLHAGPLELWKNLPGNRKRARHLQRAVSDLNGEVDVIIVNGIPGKGVDDAHPWVPAERKNVQWRITALDPETGHYAASTEPPAN